MKVNADLCKQCGLCLVCPGIEKGPDGIPVANQLCSGCGGHTPACVQMCPFGALQPARLEELDRHGSARVPEAPDFAITLPSVARRSSARATCACAIRGVGGQGNLFFGRVLTQLAFLAGYGETNIVKGETHGMAQMGGPVISTFACGRCHQPGAHARQRRCPHRARAGRGVPSRVPRHAEAGGTVLLATTRILPLRLPPEKYPGEQQFEDLLKPYQVVKVDVLKKALELGDPTGRMANVVMLGLLSTLPPFDVFPVAAVA